MNTSSNRFRREATSIKTVSFYTLGCRVNQYEEQAVRELFKKRGYTTVEYGNDCDVCVINTCAVTAESEKKSRNIISRARKYAKKVIVTGCYAELENKSGVLQNGVFYTGGCKQKGLIPLIADGEHTADYTHADGFEVLDICTDNSLPAERYRAFVKIEDGCNGRCSYCIIPQLRGKSCSRPAEDIIREVVRLADAGVSEVILTGIETSDYDDIPLSKLIHEVSKVDGIRRIRLGSLNPNCITDDFIDEAASNSKFCHHIHLSLQSGCNRILNLMRRPYSKEKADKVIRALYERIPDLLISVDIISGFPTETDEEHAETVDFITTHRFSHVHAFPYSERPGTAAVALTPSVLPSVRKSRNDDIIQRSELIRKSIAERLVGTVCQILVEKNDDGFAVGHTDTFLTAKIKSQAHPGDYIDFTVTGYDGDCLIGEEA